MRALLLRLLPLLMVLVCSIHQAAAQPKKQKTVREELPPSAVTYWDDGRLLLQQSTPDYAKALVKFREAYAASKNPRVLFNVAVCEKNLNHYARAATIFRQELTEGAGKISADEERAIKEHIAALERFVSTIEVTVDEPDATISVDDEKIGTSPMAGSVPIDIGSRRVTVRKAGFEEQSRTITVNTGVPAREKFTLDPLQKKSRVSVTVKDAPGAIVRMDGTDLGPAPFTGDVPVGRHTFSAEAAGRVTATQTSEVKYKEPLELTLTLSAKRSEGRLRVEAEPAGGVIEIDGKVVGSDTWEGPLASGAHQITVKKQGYSPASIELTMSDDANLKRKITLSEARSGGWVGWVIGSALVVGGGVVAGYFLFKPPAEQPVPGSLRRAEGEPVPASFRFR